MKYQIHITPTNNQNNLFHEFLESGERSLMIRQLATWTRGDKTAGGANAIFGKIRNGGENLGWMIPALTQGPDGDGCFVPGLDRIASHLITIFFNGKALKERALQQVVADTLTEIHAMEAQERITEAQKKMDEAGIVTGEASFQAVKERAREAIDAQESPKDNPEVVQAPDTQAPAQEAKEGVFLAPEKAPEKPYPNPSDVILELFWKHNQSANYLPNHCVHFPLTDIWEHLCAHHPAYWTKGRVKEILDHMIIVGSIRHEWGKGYYTTLKAPTPEEPVLA